MVCSTWALPAERGAPGLWMVGWMMVAQSVTGLGPPLATAGAARAASNALSTRIDLRMTKEDLSSAEWTGR